ncbi:MAG: hypothetical protein ACRDWI_12255 [Jiangellaceae bacterium]
MTVIALILLAVVIFLVVAAVTEQDNTVTVDAFDISVDTTVAEIFIAGVVSGLLALGALALLRVGLRRSRQRRQEVRDLRRQALTTPARGDTTAEEHLTAGRPPTSDAETMPPPSGPRGRDVADE